MPRSALPVLAVTLLIGCGDVKATAVDAAQPGDAAANPCAPDACLLFDEFSGASLNASLWGTMVGGGATVTQSNGVLSLHLPAAADAFVDVYSLVAFPAGTALEAGVTVTAGQFYNHTGIGFASAAIGKQCDVGETDAVMFRGQDQDGYVETKASNLYSCNKTSPMYPGGSSRMQISRAVDQVGFRQNDVMLATVTTNLPAGHLPVRFTAYTYTLAPTQPLQIDIDYVFVKHL